MELLLARPITLSKVVANTPGAEYPSGGSVLLYVGFVIPIVIRSHLHTVVVARNLLLFPVQRSFFINVIKPEQQEEQEYQHL